MLTYDAKYRLPKQPKHQSKESQISDLQQNHLTLKFVKKKLKQEGTKMALRR